MRLSVVQSSRFARTPDGRIWTGTIKPYDFWERYLTVFDAVRVVARVRDVEAVPEDWKRSDGPAVEFHCVPSFIGPWQYARRWRSVRRAVRRAFCPTDAFIFRGASVFSGLIHPWLQKTEHPYAMEVIGDPYDVFAPGVVRHPLRLYFRWKFTRQLKTLCGQACACAYVTERKLQSRYPSAPSALTTHYSCIELPNGTIAVSPRAVRNEAEPVTLIFIGTLSQMYKAPDVLIDAVAECVRREMDLRLVIVGDGRFRSTLAARASAVFLGKRLRFLGALPAGKAVMDELDRADLFVLPSRTEGLPRAMIEAMARGLPCIGSTAGGIPELLPAEDLVPSGDVEALASTIGEVVASRDRRRRMAVRNLAKAKQYRSDVLRARRVDFYHYVRHRTERWIEEGICSSSATRTGRRAA